MRPSGARSRRSGRVPNIRNVDGVSERRDWLHQHSDDTVRLLQRLIRARSENPPGNEREVSEVVLDRLNSLGAEVTRVEPRPGRVNVVASIFGDQPGPTVLCDAHLDTVPAGEGWSVDPFAAEVRDGEIYGRGATDHKSPISALLQAVACLRATSGLAGHLVLVFDADEETGGQLGMKSVLDAVKLRADYALYACATSYPLPALSSSAWVSTTYSMRAWGSCVSP